MRNAWATTLQEFWHSPTFPMWVTIAAATFFAIILLITLIRAEKTVANGALTVITLLAIGIAVAATVRRFGPLDRAAEVVAEARPVAPLVAPVAALSCLDGLAGDSVEATCEHSLFASADVTAAAVSYTAAQLAKLAPRDNSAAGTPEQQLLRQTLQRDRYGLVAQVLTVRNHCTDASCQAFALFDDPGQIRSNMRDHVYDATINRYAAAWSMAAAPPAPAPAPAVVAVAPQVAKPSTIDFPSAASIPPVNIMTGEPGSSPSTPPPAAKPPATANAQAAPAKPGARKAAATAASAAAPKSRPKPATAKPEPPADGDQ